MSTLVQEESQAMVEREKREGMPTSYRVLDLADEKGLYFGASKFPEDPAVQANTTNVFLWFEVRCRHLTYLAAGEVDPEYLSRPAVGVRPLLCYSFPIAVVNAS